MFALLQPDLQLLAKLLAVQVRGEDIDAERLFSLIVRKQTAENFSATRTIEMP